MPLHNHPATVRSIVARYVAAMEHSSPEVMKKYLHDHPNADPKDHSVAKSDGKGDEGDDEEKQVRKMREKDKADQERGKAQRSLGGHMDFAMKDMTLNPATWKGVRKLQKDLEDGKATAKDMGHVVEDLEWEVSQLHTKKDNKSKKTVEKLKAMTEKLKADAHKIGG